jgi:hypothetical protein
MLLVISIDDAKKWDEIVRSFKDYDVYYLSGYTKAFELHGDGDPTLFYYEDHNIRGMNVVMKRDIGKDENFSQKLTEGSYFDLATPYGYGGFLFEGEAIGDSLKNFNDEYSSFCKSKGIISEFARFHPMLKNYESLGDFYDISRLGKTISMCLHSAEQIWCDLISKNRNMIRKAKKSGVEVFWGQSAELYKEFIQLYNATMDKDKAKDYYYFGEDFYNSIINDIKYNSLIFYATYQGKIISMSIILFANQKMHYHLSASNREYQHFAPTNLLLYEAACWGCENGYKTFHLGGGLGSKEDSLFKFKNAFNRNSDNTFAIGRKIFDDKKYIELVGIRSKENKFVNKDSFFPSYRE